MNNERGALTIDYMFSFVLVSGFILVVITLSATLSTVELVQYITYSSARTYFAGNISEAEQKASAARKFSALRNSDVVGPLLSGGWFELRDEDVIIDYNIPDKYPELADYNTQPDVTASATGSHLFHGTVVFFTAKILEFQVPFFGSTKKDQRDSDSAFTTYIGSYLGREPSFDECNKFNSERWKFIKNLTPSLGAAYSQAVGDQTYVVINDNGC